LGSAEPIFGPISYKTLGRAPWWRFQAPFHRFSAGLKPLFFQHSSTHRFPPRFSPSPRSRTRTHPSPGSCFSMKRPQNGQTGCCQPPKANPRRGRLLVNPLFPRWPVPSQKRGSVGLNSAFQVNLVQLIWGKCPFLPKNEGPSG